MTNFIAEIGSNHNRCYDRTMALIAKAKEVGCWGVKFQLFHPDRLYAPIPRNAKKIEVARNWSLPLGWLYDIAQKCKKLHLQFGCAPFDLESADQLRGLVDFYKISSYDILRIDLIKCCSDLAFATGASVMISVGMASPEEIRNAYSVVRKEFVHAKRITLLHCVSNYPARPEECNLNKIGMYRQLYKCLVGWSDHTTSPGVIYRAVMRGASVVEFHMDLEDMRGNESQFGHCWHPADIKRVIDNVAIGDMADIGPYGMDHKHRAERADPGDGLRPMKEARK